MPKLRAIISDVINDLNAVNRDDKPSYRYIANKLRDKANYFLKQDADSRKLFKINTLWKHIECVDLKDEPLNLCPWYLQNCEKIKKSTIKIPDTYETLYGNLIIVSHLKNKYTFKEIKPYQYGEYSANPFAKGKVFWIENGYLYIPDTSIEHVKIFGVFKDTTQVDKLNGISSCLSPLDSEFAFPEYIITIAKQEVLKELVGTTKQIVPDNKPDLNTTTRQ